MRTPEDSRICKVETGAGKLLKHIGVLLLLLSILLILHIISRHNDLLFHIIVDGLSILIAACIFTIIWNVRREIDNDYFRLYVKS